MEKKRKGSGVVLWSVLTAIFAILLAAVLIGTYVAYGSEQAINIALKVETTRIVDTSDGNEDTEYFKSDFNSVEELEAHDKEVAEQLTGEGSVLLMNNDGALPLTGKNVSLFSRSSVDIVTCGTGSADIDTSNAPTLKEAMEEAGFSVNQTLWDFYEGKKADYVRVPEKGMNGLPGADRTKFEVNEIPASEYTADVKASFDNYKDAAIVVISRAGGEMYDMQDADYVDGTNILALNQDEKDMLAMIEAAGFEKTIVLINSTNAMECDFLTEGAYGVDAALWIGYTGTWGLNAVADILAGEVNPSGRLVDTYCNDNTTAPSMVGFYGNTFSNYESDEDVFYQIAGQLDRNTNYIVYGEGIYIGYRYYETRYEDTVMGQGNTAGYDYSADVAYPFGYGLSYTDFMWSDYEVSFDKEKDEFEMKVTVTNDGDAAGKDVVEAYFQSPYTQYDVENGIEKASVELCGFAKTKLLQPGESETVTITVPREEFKAYDAKNAKTYVLDDGDYYVTAATNAHTAVNNILAAKDYTTADGMDADGDKDFVYTYTNDKFDDETYAVSSATGNPITNQFDDADLNHWGTDYTYLSRSDWQGTWPVAVTELEATQEMIDEGLYLWQTYAGEASEGVEMPTMNADNGLTLAMFIGMDYDDPSWEDLLDQLTLEEMATMTGKGYHNTAAAESVGKPATTDDNGPQGFTQTLTGVTTCHCAYSDENIMAATWNVELMEEVGKCIGNDMLDLGASGLYGPAMNTHRNAYCGRDFEYYSEDGFLAGKIAAAEVKGIQSKGVYVYVKHYAFNDEETACRCISTFFNEQAAREVFLVPFEMSIVEGGAMNVMNSFARVGVRWSGAHEGLMKTVLRDEWGMKGFVLTDFSGNSAFSAAGIYLKTYDVAWGVLAGTNSWDSSADQWTDDLLKLYADDPAIVSALRESAHRILYTVANSNAMNGISSSAKIETITPWWKTALMAADIAVGALTLLCIVMLVRSIMRKKNKK